MTIDLFKNRILKGAGLVGIAATAAIASSLFVPPAEPARAAPAQEPEQITVYVLPGEAGFVGPDQKHHDTIAPSQFVLHRGVPVTFKIVNYDDGMHTIFAPDLDLSIGIEPAVKAEVAAANGEASNTPTTTTFTFTPAERGEFRWWCVAPCDGPGHWAMSDDYDGPARDGFMAGKIKVL